LRRGAAFALCCRLVAATPPLLASPDPRRAAAAAGPAFAYAEPAEANRLRNLLEQSGVMAFGFMYYLVGTGQVEDYDVAYRWPVFRRKLIGRAFGLDRSEFGTNFIGHPVGGTNYYAVARANQLGILESSAYAVGGALLWEYFGEVHEVVSANDLVVTPLAGIAIGETMTQLGAFFDRGGPSFRNRALGTLFAPVKSLNDALDGRTLARAERLDRDGFPADEWHRFDVRAGASATRSGAPAGGGGASVAREVRVSLAARLARLPDYDGPGRHSRFFDEANAAGLELAAAFGETGVVDLSFGARAVLAGHYFRDAEADARGGLWGGGVQAGLGSGYVYMVHDYDRDRHRPRDLYAAVQPLALAFEHRGAFGPGRVVARLDAGGDFGGARPYALTAYRALGDRRPLLPAITESAYYFGLGGHFEASLGVTWGVAEAIGRARLYGLTQVGSEVPIADVLTAYELRIGAGAPGSGFRFDVVAQRRSRSGSMGGADDGRGELSLGAEAGARF
jgi:hypothetical protein